jgi:aryl-alcohol dehydrogenase-like predicted oxidoreductase
MMKRMLGTSGIETSAIGLGCWAIGGPWTFNGSAAGWGTVDDAESIKAIQRAMDLGVTLFDTAANYGAGHSECVLGKAIKGKRDKIQISTKFGYEVNEAGKSVRFYGPTEESGDIAPHVRETLEASLTRLGTDYLDIFLLHVGGLEIPRALEVRAELEKLVAEGKIRAYGWSTDRLDAIDAFAGLPGCALVEQQFSVLDGNADLLDLCERRNLASLIRGPLGMGLLTGKFSAGTRFGANDVRSAMSWHPGFKDGKPTDAWLKSLEAIRGILTEGGRTLAQGALSWLLARSPATIPIPGFRSCVQVEDNAGTLGKGPLSIKAMVEIDRILGRNM